MAEIFPIAYFGSISYFQALVREKEVVFEIWDHFPKQTFRNRMQIRDAQGLQLLTLPVEKPNGSKTLTKDIRISTQQNWQQTHWRAIKTAYASAPFFEHYEKDIYELIHSKASFLLDYHANFLSFINAHLNLNLTWEFTELYKPEYMIEKDYRLLNFEELGSNKNYTQVIFPGIGFIPTISILDTLFNEGPLTRNLLF